MQKELNFDFILWLIKPYARISKLVEFTLTKIPLLGHQHLRFGLPDVGDLPEQCPPVLFQRRCVIIHERLHVSLDRLALAVDPDGHIVEPPNRLHRVVLEGSRLLDGTLHEPAVDLGRLGRGRVLVVPVDEHGALRAYHLVASGAE